MIRAAFYRPQPAAFYRPQPAAYAALTAATSSPVVRTVLLVLSSAAAGERTVQDIVEAVAQIRVMTQAGCVMVLTYE